ncbi:MAG TPA: TonB family protein [Salinivirgaceae bacterium]|nr:TonB family protein [Salinivirgaceae bacterium]
MIDRNKQIGLLATTIFHAIIAVLIFILGFVTPLPLPEEQGILINFGTDAVGMGQIETGISPQKPIPTPPQPSKQSEPDKSSDKVEKEYMTQDFEETAKIEEQKRKEKQKQKEEEKKRKEEEIERNKREEEERKRREEEARIAEQRRKIEESTKSAFGQTNTNSKSDGTGNAFGNQGSPDGSPDSKSYVGGQGQGTEGIGYSLTGRTPQGGKLPAPRYPTNEDGIVVVRVKVDQLGNVIEAVWQPQGSTITNRKLIDAAIEAAKNAKFNQDPKAEPIQVGTITYRFNIR